MRTTRPVLTFLAVLAMVSVRAQPWEPHLIATVSLVIFQAPVACDADMDGDLDLIMHADSLGAASEGYLVLAVNLAGDSVWDPIITPTVVHSNRKLQVADLDNDGDMDVFTATEAFLSNGDLTFTTVDLQPLWGDAEPLDDRYGSLDGDTYPDLVAFDGSTDSVAVLFDALGPNPQVVLIGKDPMAINSDLRTGDLDGDGWEDVVTVGFDVQADQDSVHWFRNTGGGSFLAPQALNGYPSGIVLSAPSILGIADLDSDTDGDVALDRGWLRNLGGGALGPLEPHFPAWMDDVYDYVIPTHCTDVDLDGDMDIGGHVLSTSTAHDHAFWMENSGAGTFTFRSLFWTSHEDRFPGAADLSGDGSPEILRHFSTAIGVSHLVNDTMLTPPHVVRTAIPNFEHYAIADVDGDADPDVLVSHYYSMVQLLLNDGSGAFSAPRTISLGERGGAQSIFADMDADGDQDIVMGHVGTGHISLYRNNGAGIFGDPEILSADSTLTASWLYVTAADLNGDTYPDLVSSHSGGWLIRYHANLGGNALAPPMVLSNDRQPSNDEVDLVDLDGDGLKDVVFDNVVIDEDTLFWIRNLGGGTFMDALPLLPDASAYRQHFIADVDGDLDPDIMGAQFPAWTSNLGNGVFSPNQYLITASTCGPYPTWGDVTADGIADLLIAQGYPARAHVLVGLGNGTFDPAPLLVDTVGGYPTSLLMRLADMNGDGLPDPVISGGYMRDSLVWYGPLVGDQVAGPDHAPRLLLHPNPMSNRARLVLPRPLGRDARIELVDVNGRVVRTMNGNGTREVTIERGHLDGGMYVLRLVRGAEHVSPLLFVVH